MIENIKDPRTHEIIGAAMEVHINIGSGLLEAVNQEMYGNRIKIKENPICFTANNLTKEDEAQLINSLKNSHKKVGLLINFEESSLKFKRFIN